MVVKRLKALFGSGESAEAAAAERRADPRRRVLLRATVYPIDAYADTIIRNVSRTGLMGETSAELMVAQQLHLSIDGTNYHSGIVRWTKGRRFGLDLADALAILGYEDEVDRGHSSAHQPRARRLEVEVHGRIALGPRPISGTVRDVSQSGLRLDLNAPLPKGQDVLVKLRDRPLILAKVQWSAEGRVGIKTVERMATLRLVYTYE